MIVDSLRSDFQWEISYDYHMEYSCQEYGCHEEVICRCGMITDTVVNSVDVSEILNKIYSAIFDESISTKRNNAINSLWGISEDIQRYTIDRILRINKIWKPEYWEVNVCGGYYGQEIDDILLNEELVQKISNQIEESFKIDNLEARIEYLLELENGFLLEKIKVVEVIEVDISDIYFPNKVRKSNLKLDELDHYSDRKYTGIRGVVKKDDDKFRVIDGYHRLSKTENKIVKVLFIQ
jgi:hypothetical protein